MFSFQQPTERLVTDRPPRRSFTLIELLMVIVIIGVLMSLAFTAYSRVMIRARVAQVKVEIDGMSSALADFKAKFGFYPPSRIVLSEDPASFSWRTSSRAVIRRMFPQFNFTLQQDINNNNDDTDILVLTGAECLVFFLGGVQENGVPIGFSNNPFRPFSIQGTNRIGPFFDFDAGRVSNTDVDNDGMREFISPLSTQTTPYLYVSSYDGRGYASPRTNIKIDLDVFSTVPPDPNPNPDNMTSVYLLQGGTPWKPRSFQIICPGFDNKYGKGGVFDPVSAKLDLSQADQDNITNFHSGMLAQ